ncbi:MAG: type II toxin-antitoxin system RatA family toxin [Pseudomonadota bacterium]|nr:type II toxin-antitoxin system RatA family toxin [Pseudomonadota bacterium]
MTEAVSLIRHSPFSAQQMYDLVRDVDNYSKFVPYCTASRVISVTEAAEGQSVMLADLRVAYKMLRETYTSEIKMDAAVHSLLVTQANGPFRKLDNRWTFTDTSEGSDIHFYMDFEFGVPLLRQIIQPMMGRVVEKFVSAFEERALDIYS